MDENELRLLGSYADGPKIWDAAILVPTVFSLADQGLIEPHQDRSGVYQLTERGRQVLAEERRAAMREQAARDDKLTWPLQRRGTS
jgi:DNA-binding PadR family transcriptional regulator